MSFYYITTCVSDSLCNLLYQASVAVWRIWMTYKSVYMSMTWSKTASDKSWHDSDYRLFGDGDRHEESHTISHYNCFILCYCYVSVLPLLDSR